MMRTACMGTIAGLAALACVFAAPCQSQSPGDFAGTWKGSLEVGGSRLPLVFHLAYTDGQWSGTADSPLQNATGLPLTGFDLQGNELKFSMKDIPGDPTYRGKLEGGSLTGQFSQGGQTFPLVLTRQKTAGPARPQTPKPPFPYTEQEVSYPGAGVDVGGTLAIPEGDGPFPAVLLLTGSGAQNRDEEIFQHRPFFVISDCLVRAGIAVLRVDDRGVGASTGSLAQSTIADLAQDALAGVRFLRHRPEVDSSRVGLLGHSEGAAVASLAASEDSMIAFLVLLAGPGVRGGDIVVHQIEKLSAAAGANEAEIRKAVQQQKQVIDLLVSGADSTRIAEELHKIHITEALSSPGGTVPPEREIQARISGEIRILLSPGYRSFAAFDPRPALAKVRVPVLALGGELDLQVDPEQNLPEIQKALADNTDVTIRRFPDLNHLFQRAKTGAVEEYYEIEQTISPDALNAIRDWIVRRFKS